MLEAADDKEALKKSGIEIHMIFSNIYSAQYGQNYFFYRSQAASKMQIHPTINTGNRGKPDKKTV